MLQEVSVDKFQGFGRLQRIPLKPLTLIYGPNASGKSSVIRALRLAAQSIESDYSALAQTEFVFEGDRISLASFANAVYQHSDDNDIQLGLSLSVSARTRGRKVGPRVQHLISRVKIDWVVSSPGQIESLSVTIWPEKAEMTHGELDKLPELLELTFQREGEVFRLTSHRGSDIFAYWALNGTAHGTYGKDDSVEEIDSIFSSSNDWEWGEVLDAGTYGLRRLIPFFTNPKDSTSDELSELEQMGVVPKSQVDLVNQVLSTIRFQLMIFSAGSSHIGPLREIAKRVSFSGSKQTFSGFPGVEAISSEAIDEKVAEWLSLLTDGRYTFKPMEFKAEPIGFLGPLKSQTIIDNATGTQVTFEDVGVGLSQVLPILRELGVIGPKGLPARTLTIEQPELHLHPKMQAALADLFADLIQDKHGPQIVAETHSEAFLMRVQKRLRAGSLDSKDVQILFVDQSEGENTVFPLELKKENDFELQLPLSFSGLRLAEYL